MKRNRVNEVNSSTSACRIASAAIEASSKKIHFPSEVKGSKERIYRCTYPLCNFVACTPHNVMHHIGQKHSSIENMIE
jgi:predicted proteasome-type protease